MTASTRAARLALLAGLLVFAIFIAPVMAPSVQLFYRDTGRLYYPVKLYIAQTILSGHLPLWDTMTEAGASILGQLTPGLLHPFTLVYLLLPFDLAFKLNHLLALLFAGVGTYRLSRRIGASEWASLAAAIAYGGSGYLVSMAASNLPYALGAATVPVAIDALLGFLERRSAGRLLWAAAALALSGYAGEPQSMLLAGMIGGVWAILRGLGREGIRGAARGAGLGLAWGALAGCLVAPVAFPAAAQLRRSTRFFGLTEQERRMFANDPVRLAGLFVPRAFDDVPERAAGAETGHGLSYFQEYFDPDRPAFSDSIILGAPALLFALCAAWAGRRGRLFLLGAGIFALASTGGALGIDRLLLFLAPMASLFRYAEKLIAPGLLLLSLAAALGVDRALSTTPRAAAWFAAAAGATALACLAVAGLAASGWPALIEALASRGATHDPRLAARFLAEMRAGLLDAAALSGGACLTALLKLQRPARSFAVLGAVCCAASVFASSSGLLHVAPREMVRGPFPLAEILKEKAGPSPGRWRLWVNTAGHLSFARGLPGRQSAMYGIALALMPQYDSVRGIEGVAPYFSAEDPLYTSFANALPDEFVRLFGVRFWVELPVGVSPALAQKRGFTRNELGFWVKEFAQEPRAFLVSRVRAAADRFEAMHLLYTPGFDARRMAVVPRESDVPPNSHAVQPEVHFKRPAPDHMIVETPKAEPALLVIGEHFNPGWEVTVDCQPARTVHVDLCALGALLPAGAHRVELRFWPEGLSRGLWILGLTLAGFALASAAGFVVRRARRLTKSVSRAPFLVTLEPGCGFNFLNSLI